MKLSNGFRKVVEGVGHLDGSLVRILNPQLLLDYHLFMSWNLVIPFLVFTIFGPFDCLVVSF